MVARSASIGLLTLGLASSSLGQRPPNPFERLSWSLKRTCSYNVCALIDQRDPLVAGWERVKVDRDGHGRVRKCVLQPLRMQGAESIDDGERWLTVLPDDGMIVDQESPAKRPCDDAQRLRLAEKNYEYRFEGSSRIAGREATCIVATPIHGSLDEKRYFLDTVTNYPLKLETVRNGQATVEFVTLDVSYPTRIEPDTFTITAQPGMRRIRYERPQSVVSASSARERLGFNPILPNRLPLGFEVQEEQIDDSPTWRSLVVRLTDGLARATVYEYGIAGTSVKVRALEDSTDREVGGLKLLIVADLSSEARELILNRFVSAAGDTLPVPPGKGPRPVGPGRELTPPVHALPFLERRPEAMKTQRSFRVSKRSVQISQGMCILRED